MHSPEPRAQAKSYREYSLTRGRQLELPPPVPVRADLFGVLARRRSRRSVRPLTSPELSTLLWYTAKEYSHRGARGSASYWEHRALPSAGGCHPLDVLVSINGIWMCYSPITHLLSTVRIREHEPIDRFNAAVASCIGDQSKPDGTVIWLVAQPARTARRYRWPASLLMRDAGVVVGGLVIVAEALRLKAVPLGMTGEPWLSAALGLPRRVIGLGGILVGG